jgi:cell wall-associated NlpC family hydrolase
MGQLNHIDITPYLNIPYKHGGRSKRGVDCLGIVRLFYQNEFNVSLPDYNYSESWEDDGHNYVQDGLYEHCIRVKNPLPYCIVGFKTRGSYVMDHMGLMLLDSISFLHAAINQFTVVGKLTQPYWRDGLYGFFRVKDLDKWQK